VGVQPPPSDAVNTTFVSTGHLPEPAAIQALIDEAHRRYLENTNGQNSQVYPALARVPSNLFGICVVGTRGRIYAVGDSEYACLHIHAAFDQRR
jgi:glutaminase